VKEYTDVFRRFFTYTYRSIRKDIADRPPYRPSEKVRDSWERTVARAEEFRVLFPTWEYDSALVSTPPSERRDLPPRQRAILEAFTPISTSLLEYILEVFREPLYHSDYNSVLVSFLGCSALKANYMWEDPWTYTKKLSAITTIFKVVYFVYFSRERSLRVEARTRSGEREEEAEYAEKSLLELLIQSQSLYLAESSVERLVPNAFRWATRLRNYGRTISANSTRPGYISWEGESILYKDIQLSIPQLLGSVSSALSFAQEVLFSDLLFEPLKATNRSISTPYIGLEIRYKSTLPIIPWESLGDDLNSSGIGHSLASLFLDLEPSSKSWLIRRITSSQQYRRWFPGSSSTGSGRSTEGLNPAELDLRVLREYSASIDRFLGYLAFLTHLTSGQASRGTELLSLRFQNTQGGLRNVFLDRGLIMLVTGYHKGYNHSGYTKVVYRYLPKPVGELLVYYLWLVIPFWNSVTAFLSSTRSTELIEVPSPYIWPPDLATLGKKATPESSTSGAIATATSFRKTWNTPRLSRALSSIFRSTTGQEIGISQWRHLNKAISRRYLRNIDLEGSQLPGSDSEDSDSSSGDEGGAQGSRPRNSAYDAQAGHSGSTGRNIYGRLVNEGPFGSAEARVSMRAISLAWHAFLGFSVSEGDRGSSRLLPTSSSPSTAVERPVGRKRRSSTLYNTTQPDRSRETRLGELREVDLPGALQELLGPAARFRGRQQEVLQAIFHGESPILVVQPTGSGKSLSFLLPAFKSPYSTSIVVVPLISLQEDLHRRSTQLRISSIVWDPSNPFIEARLVYTTPESFFSDAFSQFLSSTRYSRKLDRIFFDECHYILEGKPSFRPRLLELGKAGRLGIQLVYLTATLPPSRESLLFSTLDLQADEVLVIRSPTTRSNIKYSVEQVIRTTTGVELYTRIRARLEDILSRPSKGLGIVFCSTIEEVKTFASALSARAYYSNIGTREEKESIVEAWASSRLDPSLLAQGRVIVTTNALGLGLDLPTIRIVAHVGKIYKLEDYSQESGRAARDGNPSEAIVFSYISIEASKKATPIPTILPSNIGIVGVGEYLSGAYCRRVVLDFALDGRRDRRSCEPGEQQCDLCSCSVPQAPSTPPRAPSTLPQASPSGSHFEGSPLPTRQRGVELAGSRIVNKLARDSELITLRIRQREAFFSRVAEGLQESYSALLQKGCYFCFCSDKPGVIHQPKERCPEIEGSGDMEAFQEVNKVGSLLRQEGTRIQAFSGCVHCFFPQAVCQAWEQVEARGWVKVRACPALNLLLQWVLALMFDAEESKDGSMSKTYRIIQDFFNFHSRAVYFSRGIQGYKRYYTEFWRLLREKKEFGGLEGSNLAFLFQLLFSSFDEETWRIVEIPEWISKGLKKE